MIKRMMSSSISKRILTSVAGLPVLILLLTLGGWPLKGALFALSVTGMYEFYKALSGKVKIIHWAGFVCAAVYYSMLGNMSDARAVTVILIGLTIAVCVLTVLFYRHIDAKDAAVTYFGFCYITVLLSTIYLTTERHGGFLVAVALVSAWGCDTGAYIVGRTLGKSGKHKLAPVLSPKKTIEGAIGGTLTAGALTALLANIFFMDRLEINRLTLTFTIVGIICAIFAQMGDLFASAIKRQTGIKDFGVILPGHGGVMDRFDSVIFTAPILYLMALVLL